MKTLRTPSAVLWLAACPLFSVKCLGVTWSPIVIWKWGSIKLISLTGSSSAGFVFLCSIWAIVLLCCLLCCSFGSQRSDKHIEIRTVCLWCYVRMVVNLWYFQCISWSFFLFSHLLLRVFQSFWILFMNPLLDLWVLLGEPLKSILPFYVPSTASSAASKTASSFIWEQLKG